MQGLQNSTQHRNPSAENLHGGLNIENENMDCMLRVRCCDRSSFLQKAGWSNAILNIRSQDCFNLLVSDKPTFKDQLGDAIAFLTDNLSAFELLKEMNGTSELDFGVESDGGCENHRFDVPFLALAANRNVVINVSLYG